MVNRRYVFWGFALSDLIVFFTYLVVSFRDLKIPFYSDFIILLHNAELHGVNVFGNKWIMVIIGMTEHIMYLSLLLSTYLYLKHNLKVKWLVLLQTPLRVITLLSTLPFFAYQLRNLFLPIDSIGEIITFFVMLALLEIIKIIYLFKQK